MKEVKRNWTAVVLAGAAALAISGSTQTLASNLDWTLVMDQTVVSTPDQDLTRSLRAVALNEAQTKIYGGFIQKSLGSGVREYELSGSPPTATPTAFFNVTQISPSGADHQPKAVAVDDRGIVYIGSSKGSTSGDNARVFIMEPGLSGHDLFVLADIDFPGFTGEVVGGLAARNDGGVYQLYVSRFHSGSAYIERYVVTGSSVGNFGLSLDSNFSGNGQYSLRDDGGLMNASELRGIAVDDDGTIYVVSRADNLLYQISSDLTNVDTVALSNPMDVALFDGRAFVTQYNGNTSSIAEVDQSTLDIIDEFDAFDDFPRDPGPDGNFAGYAGIDIDPNGHVYLADQFYFRDSNQAQDRILRSSPLPPAPDPPVVSANADAVCYEPSDTVNVTIDLDTGEPVDSAVLFLTYDTNVLELQVAANMEDYGGADFPTVLAFFHDDTAGTIQIHLGVDASNPAPVTGSAEMAVFDFAALTDDVCDVPDLVTVDVSSFVVHQGVPTVLPPGDLLGLPEITIDDPPIFANVPANQTVFADAGTCDALVSITPPTAGNNCDANAVVTYERSDDANLTLADPFPAGQTTTIEWTATDDCGRTSTATTDITVQSETLVDVDIELDAGFSGTSFERCVVFEFENGSGITIVSEELSFVDALAMDTIEVPCGAYDCVQVRNPLHSLRSVAVLDDDGVVYSIQALSADGRELIQGDLNDDGVVDILDFSIYVWQFGENYGDASSSDTDCNTPFPHADMSGSGIVELGDFTFISNNFLDADQVCPPQMMVGGEGRGVRELSSLPASQPKPRTSITVRELHEMGLGHLAVADLNNDGVVDEQDIAIFLMEGLGN